MSDPPLPPSKKTLKPNEGRGEPPPPPLPPTTTQSENNIGVLGALARVTAALAQLIVE